VKGHPFLTHHGYLRSRFHTINMTFVTERNRLILVKGWGLATIKNGVFNVGPSNAVFKIRERKGCTKFPTSCLCALVTPWSTVLLQKLTVAQIVNKPPPLIESEGSSPCSQKPATGPYPKQMNPVQLSNRYVFIMWCLVKHKDNFIFILTLPLPLHHPHFSSCFPTGFLLTRIL
jgi:hypothetical protein